MRQNKFTKIKLFQFGQSNNKSLKLKLKNYLIKTKIFSKK